MIWNTGTMIIGAMIGYYASFIDPWYVGLTVTMVGAAAIGIGSSLLRSIPPETTRG